MKDNRILKLAKQLVQYSVSLQPGENLLIECFGSEIELVNAVVKEAQIAGGIPFVSFKDNRTERALLLEATPEQLKRTAEREVALMEKMDAYIGIRSGLNISEMSDVPSEQKALYQKYVWTPVHNNIRVPKTKWCVLRYPTPSMARLAGMSTEAFEDFYFDVCTLNYEKMNDAMDSLVQLMEKTNKVRIVGKNTDLSFSIKDIPVEKSAGHKNIPDGEVFTSPVRDSVNGVISHNTPSPYQGFTFTDIQLTFENGKIVKATANDTERINEILNTDEGARYIGEFAIGLNPFIQDPMEDILFDEKIDGSFHFTPGQCYDVAPNGNDSDIHWDMVSIQRPEYGGGEIYFDDVLIRKDGKFLIDELKGLNPDNLKG